MIDEFGDKRKKENYKNSNSDKITYIKMFI